MSGIDVVFASGPTYKSGSVDLLMPFSYNNGRLDLPSGNASSYTDPTGSIGNAGASVRLLGGTNLVTSLGTNLRNFITSKIWDGYTVTGSAASITIVSQAKVTRVQQLSSKYLAPTWDQKSYNVVASPWDNANFIGYNAVYLFTKPLVIQVNATGNGYTGPICITFQTSWDH